MSKKCITSYISFGIVIIYWIFWIFLYYRTVVWAVSGNWPVNFATFALVPSLVILESFEPPISYILVFSSQSLLIFILTWILIGSLVWIITKIINLFKRNNTTL